MLLRKFSITIEFHTLSSWSDWSVPEVVTLFSRRCQSICWAAGRLRSCWRKKRDYRKKHSGDFVIQFPICLTAWSYAWLLGSKHEWVQLGLIPRKHAYYCSLWLIICKYFIQSSRELWSTVMFKGTILTIQLACSIPSTGLGEAAAQPRMRVIDSPYITLQGPKWIY